jgi:hypothetical protein
VHFAGSREEKLAAIRANRQVEGNAEETSSKIKELKEKVCKLSFVFCSTVAHRGGVFIPPFSFFFFSCITQRAQEFENSAKAAGMDIGGLDTSMTDFLTGGLSAAEVGRTIHEKEKLYNNKKTPPFPPSCR